MSTWLDTRHFRNSLDRLFNDFLEGYPYVENGSRTAPAFPPLNCWEDEGNLYAECELPGIEMNDLEIFVVGRDLTVKGQRKPREVGEATYHRRERDVGSFHRVVQLPVDIDSGKVSAELTNGVLTITLPKAPEAKPRKIEVKCVAK